MRTYLKAHFIASHSHFPSYNGHIISFLRFSFQKTHFKQRIFSLFSMCPWNIEAKKSKCLVGQVIVRQQNWKLKILSLSFEWILGINIEGMYQSHAHKACSCSLWWNTNLGTDISFSLTHISFASRKRVRVCQIKIYVHIFSFIHFE